MLFYDAVPQFTTVFDFDPEFITLDLYREDLWRILPSGWTDLMIHLLFRRVGNKERYTKKDINIGLFARALLGCRPFQWSQTYDEWNERQLNEYAQVLVHKFLSPRCRDTIQLHAISVGLVHGVLSLFFQLQYCRRCEKIKPVVCRDTFFFRNTCRSISLERLSTWTTRVSSLLRNGQSLKDEAYLEQMIEFADRKFRTQILDRVREGFVPMWANETELLVRDEAMMFFENACWAYNQVLLELLKLELREEPNNGFNLRDM